MAMIKWSVNDLAMGAADVTAPTRTAAMDKYFEVSFSRMFVCGDDGEITNPALLREYFDRVYAPFVKITKIGRA